MPRQRMRRRVLFNNIRRKRGNEISFPSYNLSPIMSRRLAEERINALQVELFSAVRSGDFSKFEKVMKTSHGKFTVDTRDSSPESDRPGASLLQCCIYDSSPLASMGSGVASGGSYAGRIKIAKYLLSQSPPADCRVLDGDQRNVLHLAAQCNHTGIIDLLMSDKENDGLSVTHLDINGRCGKLGWTPLHYAAERGNLSACKCIVRHGGCMSTHVDIISKDGVAKAKGPTPVELARQRLKKPLSAAHASALESVCMELTKLAEELEHARVRQEDEFMRQQHKLQAEKEAAEKQLKVQEDREAVLESQRKEEAQAAESSKKSKKKNKKNKTVETTDDKGLASGAIPKGNISCVAVAGDLISRDEMLDNLISMGFAEQDCLAAILACGRNIDLAISWLCERPQPPVPKSIKKQPTVHPPAKHTVGSSMSSAASRTSQGVGSKEAAAAGHKEELRRINKAWNMKAEDEMKKVHLSVCPSCNFIDLRTLCV
jgi:hypothetical protein